MLLVLGGYELVIKLGEEEGVMKRIGFWDMVWYFW